LEDSPGIKGDWIGKTKKKYEIDKKEEESVDGYIILKIKSNQ